jgi:tRNA (cmo5U34)-methyltransferase
VPSLGRARGAGPSGGLNVDREKRMEEVRTNFTKGSGEYDDRIRKIIPRYDEMLEALVSSTALREGGVRVLDIGCGTGAASEQLLRTRPEAQLTCLDMTESMLDLARRRLEGRGARFVLADIHEFDLDGPYDAVISSLALHHLVSDQDKKDVYRRILDALAPGGSFFNADIVLGSSDAVQEMYMMKWKEHMYRSFPRTEVDEVQVPRYRREDSPARLVDHLRWLEEVGFKDVDIIWKRYNFAVYGGSR